MELIVDFLQSNYKWIFSGLGLFIIGGICRLLFVKKSRQENSVIQKDVSAGGDVVGRDKKS